MPSIRDLKGRPIEPLTSLRPETVVWPTGRESSAADVQASLVVKPAVPLPEDIETGLQDVERALASILMATEALKQQVVILRQLAERDAARLVKFESIMKALKE